MEPVKSEVFDPGNAKFRILLRGFEQIIKGDPKPEDVKEILEELKTKAKTASDLTGRQIEAIVDRCNNYMAGDYGKTKRPEHFEQAKPSK